MSKYFSTSSKYFNYYNKQRTPSVEEKIADLEDVMKSQGVDVPEKTKRSMLDRLVFGAMGTSNYAMMGGFTKAKEYGNKNEKKLIDTLYKSDAGVFDKLKAIVSYKKGDYSAFGKGFVEGVKGGNPFGDKYEAGRKTADDLFNASGWRNDPNDKWNAPANIGRALAAFGTDVALDPTTYMTFGVGGLFRGTGKTLAGKAIEKTIKEGGEATAKQLAKLSARELAQTNVNSVFKSLGTQGVIDKLAEKGVKVTADEVPDIIAKVQRDSRAFLNPTGQSMFGSKADAALRKIGDKTVAPFINTGIDKLAKSGVGKKAGVVKNVFQNTFDRPGLVASTMAKTDPVRYMQEYKGGVQYINSAFVSYKKMNKEFSDNVTEKFKGIPKDILANITHITEAKDAMKKFEYSAYSHDITKLSDDAVELTKYYDKNKEKIEDIIKTYEKSGENAKALKLLEAYKETMDNISAVKSQEYINLLNSSTDLKSVFNSIDDFESFLNNVRNDNVGEIEKKLKDMGVDNAKKAAYEARTILDKAVAGDNVNTRKYFIGQQTLKRPVNMDAGHPMTEPERQSMFAQLNKIETAARTNRELKLSRKTFEQSRTGKIYKILNQYENTYPATASVVERTAMRKGWLKKLNQMNDVQVNDKFAKALQLEKSDVKEITNEHDALAKKLANHVADISVGNRTVAYNRNYRKLSQLPWDELKESERYLKEQGRRFDNKDVVNQIDSGGTKNLADAQETERYTKNAKEYAGGDIDSVIVHNDAQLTETKHRELLMRYPTLEGKWISQLDEIQLKDIFNKHYALKSKYGKGYLSDQELARFYSIYKQIESDFVPAQNVTKLTKEKHDALIKQYSGLENKVLTELDADQIQNIINKHYSLLKNNKEGILNKQDVAIFINRRNQLIGKNTATNVTKNNKQLADFILQKEYGITPDQKAYTDNFDNIIKYINSLPQKERVNLYHTLGIRHGDIVLESQTIAPFTDSAKPVINKYFADKEPVRNMGQAFNANLGKTDASGKPLSPEHVETKHNVYNIDGLEIYQPVDVRSDATVSAIIEGARNVGVKHKGLARLLGTMKIYLSDIDGASEAITGNATIIFGKNKNNIPNYDKYVAENIMPHEIGHEFGHQINNLLFRRSGGSDWRSAIKKDGNELFKGEKVANILNINDKLMNEDLAESFKLFLRNSKAFKAEYPFRYALLKQSLGNLKVPDANINKAYNVSGVKMQPDAYKILESERLTLEAQRQMLLNKTRFVSQADAEAELENIVKLQENNYANKEFTDLYETLHPGEELFTKEAVMTNKITARLDAESEAAKKILKKYTPKRQTEIKNFVNFFADQYNDIYDKEVIAGYMDANRVIGYAPRQQYPGGGGGGKINITNQFNKQRTIAETIQEHNNRIIKELGFNSLDEASEMNLDGLLSNEAYEELLSAYRKQAWIEDAVELLLMRGQKSNQLLFTKNFYNHIVGNFGTVYKELVNVPTGTKLHASSEDVYKVIKAHVEYTEFDENLYNQLVSKARREGKKLTPGLDAELRQNATLLKVDEDKLAKLVEDTGLSKKYIEAFGEEKRGLEAFLKLSPITPISEKTFANIKNIDPRFTSFSASDMLIDKLNKAGMMQLDKNAGIALDVFDFWQRLWKINATSANFGFGVRNMVSNQFQQFLNVGLEVMNPMSQYQSARIVSGKFDDNATIKTGNKSYSEREIVELAKKHGVLQGSLVTNMIKDTDKETFLQKVSNTKDAFKSLTTDNKQSGKDLLKTIGNAANPLDANKFIVYKIGSKTNEFFENQSRMNLFLANLKQGKGVEEASDNVAKYLFDYSDLSDFETNVMKRIIPFYTWMRKNIPLQVEQYLNNPRAYSTYAKVKNNVDAMTSDEERLEDSQKNQFAQDWMQLPFSTIAKDGAKQPTFFNANLPLNDLDKLDVTGTGRSVFTALTPFLKLPTELVMNKNVFFNNNISKGIGDTDDAPGYLQALMGGTTNKPVQMSPELRYVLKNIGSLENLSKTLQASSQTRPGQPVSDKALALLKWLGGMSGYSYDVEKYTKWSDRDRLKQLRDLARSKGLIE